jgi:proteasome accessory factor C
MGRRSAGESIIAILGAFIEDRSWSQAELARRVGISVEQVRRHLDALSEWLPFEEPDHDPPHVYWNLPKHWFPAGVQLPAADADELLRQLARAPETDRRNALLLQLAKAAHSRKRRPQEAPATTSLTASLAAHEDRLRVLEDACRQRQAVSMNYYSASRGDREEDRIVSVQRVVVGPLTRFVAHCHRAAELRFFRLSRVDAVRLAPSIPFVITADADIDAFLATSVAGYRDPIAPVRVAFTVDRPECNWVKDSLPLPMTTEPVPGGLRFSSTTSGVVALARFVVGLGDAARAETPELLAAVHRLAHGALENTTPSVRSVPPIHGSRSSTTSGQ